MATQAALIAETITGMKRTLSRKYDSSDSDASIDRATNRGHKLKRQAQHAHEGQLYGKRAYKKKIEHAGYSRYVLSKNPKRYDYYGDELEEEDEDTGVDAVALADNPYNDMRLEEILKPLASAAELPNHPSMSYAYTSPLLERMVQQACEMVQREEKTLWQVKKLAMAFRGDPNRITGEEICSRTDTRLFEPEQLSLVPPLSVLHFQVVTQNEQVNSIDGSISHPATSRENLQTTQQLQSSQPKHVELTEADPKNSSIHAKGTSSPNVNSQVEAVKTQTIINREAVNLEPNTFMVAGDKTDNMQDLMGSTLPNVSSAHEQGNEVKTPLHRMTTRAQAHVASDKIVPLAPRSASPAISESASAHPIFQITPWAIPNVDRALPPMEAEETRAIIFLWIQKQEEVVRGAVRMYEGFLKAERMRKSVFGWCKAEGHLGEMSDGEDWYDKVEWGLDEGLRKGQEEEEDEIINPSKKTRGRRAQ